MIAKRILLLIGKIKLYLNYYRKKIALTYLKTWFFFDFISIIPVSIILDSNKDYTSLARIARLPRLYRVLKMTKYLISLKSSFILDWYEC
jgi:hypothetical protein